MCSNLLLSIRKSVQNSLPIVTLFQARLNFPVNSPALARFPKSLLTQKAFSEQMCFAKIRDSGCHWVVGFFFLLLQQFSYLTSSKKSLKARWAYGDHVLT